MERDGVKSHVIEMHEWNICESIRRKKEEKATGVLELEMDGRKKEWKDENKHWRNGGLEPDREKRKIWKN